ncbi:M23 family metallopeptidase [Nocardioides litoris]|uniref:M23 family metallopeptidase n=1 Tax=Nocardioides litoris TaxID=1926648 RepID=UPI001476EE2B|nr:M23 family metallopeptidase [Nocardioides litoris]
MPGRRALRPEPAAVEAAVHPASSSTSGPVSRETLSPSTGTHYVGDLDHTAELPLARAQTPGKRKAVKHAGSRGPLFRGLPSPPVLLGLATMAVAVGGVMVAPDDDGPALAGTVVNNVRPATALSGSDGIATVGSDRQTLSRSNDRQTLAQASGQDELVAAAEAQAQERNAALSTLAAQAEKQAAKIKENRWVLPLNPSIITATFGQYGLWASSHTGLDFNGENGDPIHAIANGVVTFVGYDGSYGNKTVVTLEDGTEIWYAHQTTQYVSVGDVVTGNEVIGTVGSTGNVTGSHLHVEVRPGGGDPVDPYAAFVVHGVQP